MPERDEHSKGEFKGDWTHDVCLPYAGHCTECGNVFDEDDSFWLKRERKLCSDCITLVLNAAEDHIRETGKILDEMTNIQEVREGEEHEQSI